MAVFGLNSYIRFGINHGAISWDDVKPIRRRRRLTSKRIRPITSGNSN